MSPDPNAANIGKGQAFHEKELRWAQQRLECLSNLQRAVAYFRGLPTDRKAQEMQRYEALHGPLQRGTLEDCLKPNLNLKGCLREFAKP